VLGSEATIRGITIDDLQAWLATHYGASELVLVAAGKLEHQLLVDLAQDAFGDMAASNRLRPQPATFVGGQHFEPASGEQAHIAVAMSAPSWGAPDAFASQLFADVIGAGSSCRLFQELREEQGLAYSVAAGAQNFAGCGMFWTYVAVDRSDAGHVHREVERVLRDTVERLGEREVERARAMAKAAMLMNLESCWGQASYLATRLIRDGALIEPSELVARLDAARDPWSVSGLAQAAAVAALADEAYARQTREWVRRERPFLAAQLAELPGFAVYPPSANFILVRAPEPAHLIQERLGPQGILIRDCRSFAGLSPMHLRVAIRSRPENLRLVEALRS
jgi:predicted Zn-dependent peptidase